jgi:putative addiction module component (TIGR02574 family)
MDSVNVLNLDKMTIAEKLSIMEKLWSHLCANPESIPSPGWHREVLETRTQRISEGKEQFHSLESVKSRIKNRTS